MYGEQHYLCCSRWCLINRVNRKLSKWTHYGTHYGLFRNVNECTDTDMTVRNCKQILPLYVGCNLFSIDCRLAGYWLFCWTAGYPIGYFAGWLAIPLAIFWMVCYYYSLGFPIMHPFHAICTHSIIAIT